MVSIERSILNVEVIRIPTSIFSIQYSAFDIQYSAFDVRLKTLPDIAPVNSPPSMATFAEAPDHSGLAEQLMSKRAVTATAQTIVHGRCRLIGCRSLPETRRMKKDR